MFKSNLFERSVVFGVKVAVVVSCPESLEFGRDEHFLLQHLNPFVELVALVKVKVDLVDPFALSLGRFALAIRSFFAHLFALYDAGLAPFRTSSSAQSCVIT